MTDYKAVLERFQKDLDRELAYKKNPQNVLHLLKQSCEGGMSPEKMSEIKGYYDGLETAKYLLEFAMFKQGMIDGLKGDIDGADGDAGKAGSAGTNESAGDNKDDDNSDNVFKKSTKELNPADLMALLLLGALGGISATVLTEDDLKKMMQEDRKNLTEDDLKRATYWDSTVGFQDSKDDRAEPEDIEELLKRIAKEPRDLDDDYSDDEDDDDEAGFGLTD